MDRQETAPSALELLADVRAERAEILAHLIALDQEESALIAQIAATDHR